MRIKIIKEIEIVEELENLSMELSEEPSYKKCFSLAYDRIESLIELIKET